jgi:hypothetical protein
VINLYTAKQIGLTIPPSVLASGGQGDQVNRDFHFHSGQVWDFGLAEPERAVFRFALGALLVAHSFPTEARHRNSSDVYCIQQPWALLETVGGWGRLLVS